MQPVKFYAILWIVFFLVFLIGLPAIQLVRQGIAIRKLRRPKALFSLGSTILALSAATCGYIFNMGWIRVILLWLGVPFFHGNFFIFVAGRLMLRVPDARKKKILTALLSVSYAVPYLFLPDGGDTGDSYMFFGLLPGDHFLSELVLPMFVLNLALSLYVLTVTEKKKKASEPDT